MTADVVPCIVDATFKLDIALNMNWDLMFDTA